MEAINRNRKSEAEAYVILSPGEKIFNVINTILVGVIILITLYPFWYVLISSFSDYKEVINGNVLVFPKKLNLDSYLKVLEIKGIWRSYLNSIYLTVVGTFVSMFITIAGAYALSKKRLRYRGFFSLFIAFSMWFNAGMIPTYLNLRDLGLLNSLNGLVIAFAVSSFNVILMRTYFQTIPESLEESAKIDGASDIRTLIQIYLPLSKPSIATVGLYYGISRWNGYFWAMILLREREKVPLQVLLKKLIVEMNLTEELSMSMDVVQNLSQETVIYATIIVSIIPVLIVYPYLQKYIVQGLLVGSVKG